MVSRMFSHFTLKNKGSYMVLCQGFWFITSIKGFLMHKKFFVVKKMFFIALRKMGFS